MTSPNADPHSLPSNPSSGGIAARSNYYEAATTWAEDTHTSLRASQRTAWLVAGIATGVAALQAIALIVLLPLKQAIPYTITVDRETGYVQTARGVKLGNLSESEAIAQSFVMQYILARETFDSADYRELYRKTLAWSQGGAETEYLRDWDKNNPSGIRTRVGPNTRIQVTVKSVTILGPRSASVRFDTERTDSPGGGGMRQPWIATVVYSFYGKPINEQDRDLNPLGFQISSYRRDAETTQPVAMPAPVLPVQPMPIDPATVTLSPSTTPSTNAVVPPSANPVTPAPAPAVSKTGNPNGEEFPNQ